MMVSLVSCEKCWRDAGGDPERYRELLNARDKAGTRCTPEEQAGPDATECPGCKRKTVHQLAKVCMTFGCEERSRALWGDM